MLNHLLLDRRYFAGCTARETCQLLKAEEAVVGYVDAAVLRIGGLEETLAALGQEEGQASLAKH